MRTQRRFLTAAEIHLALGGAGAKVALSTVYRTLDHLKSKGDATVRTDADGETQYMLCESEPEHHHHHAICQTCGRVEDVDCTAIEQFTKTLRATNGFELNGHAMEFFGKCRSCK